MGKKKMILIMIFMVMITLNPLKKAYKIVF